MKVWLTMAWIIACAEKEPGLHYLVSFCPSRQDLDSVWLG